VRARAIRGWAAALGLAVLAAPAIAAAGGSDVAKCVDANTRAQALRRDGKLAAARAELLNCGNPSCPELVRDDCAQRLDEVERAQPTILFDARDGDGHDLVAVRVTVDGQPLAERLEGKALRVDPGQHTFTFTVEGQPTVTQAFVLREGEKERRERVIIGQPTVLAPPSPAVHAPTQATTPPPAETPSGGLGTRRVLGLGLAGAGVVGLGVGAAFGLMASSAWSNAKNACSGDTSRCPNANVADASSDKSTAVTDGTISTVGFVAGGVLLAAGGVLFILGDPHEASGGASISVAPAIGPTQQGLWVHGTF
jgi:hypothetical protein